MSDSDLPLTSSAWRRRVWALSWPVILSNSTVPLVGAVDTAVVGHLSDPAYIGAVAFGALIFTGFTWVLGFLRMSTTGFIAQAWGADDLNEVSATALRALLLAVAFGVIILLFQTPLRDFVFWCFGGSVEVEALALDYYGVRIWSVPAAMTNLVVIGVLFGMQQMRLALVVQLLLNGLNIGLDLLFVRGFGWGVKGVASATVISELAAAVLGLWMAWHGLQRMGCRWPAHSLLDPQRLKSLLVVNANLMLRTACVQFTSFYFISVGAQLGNVTLAANAVLMHFFHIMTFGLDGFAHAAEALAGRAYGAQDRPALRSAVVSSMSLAALIAVAFSFFYWLTGPTFIAWMSGLETVRSTAATYLPWVILGPLFAVWAYLLDGVYLGATRTVEMRNGMLIALTVYLICVWVSRPLLGNHGLWLSITVFLIVRGATLGWWYSRLEQETDRAISHS